MYGRLLEKDVTLSPMTSVTRIGEDSVDVSHEVTPEITRTIEPVDTVVIAAGGQAIDGLYLQLGSSAEPESLDQPLYYLRRKITYPLRLPL